MSVEIENKQWVKEIEYYNEELDEFLVINSIHYCRYNQKYLIFVRGNNVSCYYNTYEEALKDLIEEICIEYDEEWEIFEL